VENKSTPLLQTVTCNSLLSDGLILVVVCRHVDAVADTPALRHYSYNYKFYGAVPGAQLVVRMVSEINNYDYIADVWLSNDGVMDVRVVTSG
jgi:Cu2+-containing amine oxidase